MQMKVFHYGKICLATRRALYKHISYIYMNRNGCIMCIHKVIKYVYIYSMYSMSVYVTSLCRVCPCCCLCWFCVWVRLGATAWVKEKGFTEWTHQNSLIPSYPGQQKTHETSEPFENPSRASRNIGWVVPFPVKVTTRIITLRGLKLPT